MRVALIASFVFVVGCAHTPAQVEEKPAPVAVAPAAAPAPAPAPAPVIAKCTGDGECAEGSLCVRQQCVEITAELEECKTVRVHFEFNQAQIRADDQAALQRMARCLRANRAMSVLIEGNADERGTEEYNLVLGSQRASRVEAYLASLGASKSQLDTVSYGYERPLCTEHNEACWAKNRRAALKPEIAPAKEEKPAKKVARP